MKFPALVFGFLSVSSILIFSPSATNSASGQCVQVDQSVQVSISGSGPAKRRNNIELRSEGPCTGSYGVTTGTQVHVGPGQAVQERNVRQTLRGDRKNPAGSGRTIQIQVNPQIDVRNPADKYRNLIDR